MKLIKSSSIEKPLKTGSYNFRPISNLDEFDIQTSYVKGRSPTYESNIDKLFMVLDGNLQLKMENKSTEIEAGDILMLECGEKFQFNTADGARLLQFNKHISSIRNGHVKDLACGRQRLIKFLNKPIPKKDIYTILKVGMYAPSRADKQPWKFVVITDPEMKRKIRDSAEKIEKKKIKKMEYETDNSWKKPFLENAPILICIFGDHRYELYKESAWLAIGWMLMAIEDFGLTSKIYSPAEMKFLTKLLEIGEPFLPEIILAVGYADITEAQPIRKDLLEVVSWI